MKAFCRRSFLAGSGAAFATVLGCLIRPDIAHAETVSGKTLTSTMSWYTGTATSRLDWEPGEYVTFYSSFSFSHTCQPGSVTAELLITGGQGFNAAVKNFSNVGAGREFRSSVSCYDVNNTNYGGMFQARGIWRVPDYANFLMYTSHVSCSMYGLRSAPSNEMPSIPDNSDMTLVIGQNGTPGYVHTKELNAFDGAEQDEILELIDKRIQTIDVYDSKGTVVDFFVVEYLPLELIS